MRNLFISILFVLSIFKGSVCHAMSPITTAIAKEDTTSNEATPLCANMEQMGAVSTIEGRIIGKYFSTDILTSLQGRLPGLNIAQYRGWRLPHTSSNTTTDILGSLPSGFGTGIVGDNTMFSLSGRGNGPVVLVDGVERELYSIDPDAIESVSYKRDALSSMVLGMRSSRGVLLITTKKPVTGKLQFSFTGKMALHSSVNKLKPLSSSQYAYLLNEAFQNDGRQPIYGYDDYLAWVNHTNPYTHPDINWEDQLLNSSAVSQSYNLNVSGGSKTAQFFISLGYMNDEGLFRTDAANKYNTNLNFNRYMLSSKVNRYKINFLSSFKL